MAVLRLTLKHLPWRDFQQWKLVCYGLPLR